MFILQGPATQAIPSAIQATSTLLPQKLGEIITSIGGLGTAAFGLVDAAKTVDLGRFSINRIGFERIQKTIKSLTPSPAAGAPPSNALPQANVIDTVKANWMNGTDLSSQKAIAKSLIKLNLSEGNASALAKETNVDPGLLKSAATLAAAGKSLPQPESDVFARFDLIVTAMLDTTYQCSDLLYRNWTRAIAAAMAVGLAMTGGWAMDSGHFQGNDRLLALLVGLLATPLAPIAKDLSTALATAVNTLQLVKK